jgi:hypothetical protein
VFSTPSVLRPGLVHTVVAVSFAGSAALGAATLKPESVAAWTVYVNATEQRIAAEIGRGDRFLSTDLEPDAAARRRALASGRVLVDEVETRGGDGDGIDVPSAMLHHWRGAVFIPGASLDRMLDELGTGAPGAKQEDVLDSKVLSRTPDATRIFLRVQRKKFVTVVYNTEHLVRFERHGATRASSRSTATRIAEVENANTAGERELVPGQDRGFLWRWNAYWRYEQVAGGVIAECESVSLSRGIPSVFRFLVGPLIRSTAEESMERTLVTFRDRFGGTSRPAGDVVPGESITRTR